MRKLLFLLLESVKISSKDPFTLIIFHSQYWTSQHLCKSKAGSNFSTMALVQLTAFAIDCVAYKRPAKPFPPNLPQLPYFDTARGPTKYTNCQLPEAEFPRDRFTCSCILKHSAKY